MNHISKSKCVDVFEWRLAASDPLSAGVGAGMALQTNRHDFSVPTSMRQLSLTRSVQRPWTDLPSNADRPGTVATPKVVTRSFIEPPL